MSSLSMKKGGFLPPLLLGVTSQERIDVRAFTAGSRPIRGNRPCHVYEPFLRTAGPCNLLLRDFTQVTYTPVVHIQNQSSTSSSAAATTVIDGVDEAIRHNPVFPKVRDVQVRSTDDLSALGRSSSFAVQRRNAR